MLLIHWKGCYGWDAGDAVVYLAAVLMCGGECVCVCVCVAIVGSLDAECFLVPALGQVSVSMIQRLLSDVTCIITVVASVSNVTTIWIV